MGNKLLCYYFLCFINNLLNFFLITAEVLEQLNQGDKQVSVEIHKYTKDQSQHKKLFESIITCITEGGKVLYCHLYYYL
jgi:hypothetical protein